MSKDDNVVVILFEEKEEIFSIDDLDPEALKQMFGLDFEPLTVKLEGTNRNILVRRRENFVAGKILILLFFSSFLRYISFIFEDLGFWSHNLLVLNQPPCKELQDILHKWLILEGQRQFIFIYLSLPSSWQSRVLTNSSVED